MVWSHLICWEKIPSLLLLDIRKSNLPHIWRVHFILVMQPLNWIISEKMERDFLSSMISPFFPEKVLKMRYGLWMSKILQSSVLHGKLLWKVKLSGNLQDNCETLSRVFLMRHLSLIKTGGLFSGIRRWRPWQAFLNQISSVVADMNMLSLFMRKNVPCSWMLFLTKKELWWNISRMPASRAILYSLKNHFLKWEKGENSFLQWQDRSMIPGKMWLALFKVCVILLHG